MEEGVRGSRKLSMDTSKPSKADLCFRYAFALFMFCNVIELAESGSTKEL